MKSRKYKDTKTLANDLGLSKEQGAIADMKAKLTKEVIKTINRMEVTHQEVADSSGVPRSAITGIANGSLQKVTLDRLVHILNALGKTIELRIKAA